jgi:uncharacterized protein YkuJ
MQNPSLRDIARAELNTTVEGEQFIDARRKLSAYGKGQKLYDFRQVVEHSTRFISKGTVITPLNFFSGKNTDTVKFPDDSSAYDFEGIRADVEIHLGANEQTTLEAMKHFLRNSSVTIKVDKTERMKLPLDQVVPFAINFVDGKWTKQEIRPGFVFDELLKLHTSGHLQVSLEPAPGYSTDATKVVGVPELDKESNGDNYVRISLFGTSIAAL